MSPDDSWICRRNSAWESEEINSGTRKDGKMENGELRMENGELRIKN